MTILLIRHGRPDIRTDQCRTASGWADWVEHYDRAGLDPALPPPAETLAAVRDCRYFVCSSLPRSQESATALGVTPDLCDAAFRELEMPRPGWRTPKLPLTVWLFLFRLLWLLGYSARCESVSDGKARAQTCADRLAALAATHGTVAFVGHGALIWLIARHLKATGWTGPRKAPRQHWGFGVYRRPPQP